MQKLFVYKITIKEWLILHINTQQIDRIVIKQLSSLIYNIAHNELIHSKRVS